MHGHHTKREYYHTGQKQLNNYAEAVSSPNTNSNGYTNSPTLFPKQYKLTKQKQQLEFHRYGKRQTGNHSICKKHWNPDKYI